MVDRYEPEFLEEYNWTPIRKDDDGDYVLYSDYEALEAEVTRLQKLYAKWGYADAPCPKHFKQPILIENNCASCRSEALEAKLAALVEAAEIGKKGLMFLYSQGKGNEHTCQQIGILKAAIEAARVVPREPF